MGAARRILILAAGALFGAGPLLAQTPTYDVSRRLTDSPQDIIALLAGQAGPAAPVQTFEYTPPADAPLTVKATGAGPEPQTQGRSQDQVEGVIVRARGGEDDLPGPAWWKVTSGDSTVWIMGTPDLFPLHAKFDQRALQKHMAAARLLIVPGSPGAQVSSKTKFPPEIFKTPLSARMSPALYARLGQRLDFNAARDKADRAAQMVRLPRWMPLSDAALIMPNDYSAVHVITDRLATSLTLPGPLGNPARDAALQLANQHRGLLMSRMPYSEVAMTTYRVSIPVPQDLQEQCLSHVLDILDSGATMASLSDAVQSWAIGDVANALKRYDVLNTCSYGPGAADFWGHLIGNYDQAIRSALGTPGETVAIVEFDPLMVSGGVLDRLKAGGFTITPPATLS